jgi:integrase
MASVWIRTRATKDGENRYLVEYRVAGRESSVRHGGSFKVRRDALERAGWISGELRALRIPELRLVEAEPPAAPTFAAAAESWLASRVDVADGTRAQQRTSINRAAKVLGPRRIDEIGAHDVAAMVATLVGEGLKPSFIRKIAQATAMLFDHAGVTPNPARDKTIVRLPRDRRPEIAPPTAEHVHAVHRLLPSRYRLPLLVLDATGMRLGELEALSWGDLDEPRGRWRVSQAVAKTGQARWVPVPPVLFEAVTGLVARDDRSPERRVFQGFAGDRFRTAIARACTAPACPPSARTTSATAASACCTWAASPGRGSASTSASATWP